MIWRTMSSKITCPQTRRWTILISCKLKNLELSLIFVKSIGKMVAFNIRINTNSNSNKWISLEVHWQTQILL